MLGALCFSHSHIHPFHAVRDDFPGYFRVSHVLALRSFVSLTDLSSFVLKRTATMKYLKYVLYSRY